MNLYYSILNMLLLFSAAVLVKHSWYRLQYFLQMFQQHGYKTNEFYNWIIHNFNLKVVPTEYFLFLVLVLSLLIFLSEQLTVTSVTLVLSLFTVFWFGTTTRYNREKKKKPLVYTPRMKRLFSLQSAILLFFMYIITDLSFSGRLMNSGIITGNAESALMIAEPYALLTGLLIVDVSIPFFLFAAAWILKPLEERIHEGFKEKARRKLAGMPGLKIIAVTGSYGKTSTKFLIHSMLKERYNVCVTPGSYNTPMGISKVINNELHARHQILILEMGARYEGNIRELCSIARPDVAVLTNVGKAHMETFGSREAIIREKSTLAKEVKPEGILVLNADDEAVASMAGLNKNAEVIFSGIQKGSVRASDIAYDENGTTFTLLFQKKPGKVIQQKISMKLLGLHNVRNFLLAAAVADKFSIRAGTIALAAEQLEPVEHRLEMKRQGGLLIIDDAFNSNPVGAKNAVEILASFGSGRKIIITPGMVELGDIQDEENGKFGEAIGEAALDLVILVGNVQTRPIHEGIRKVQGGSDENVRIAASLFEANSIIRDYARDGDVILYENDLPDVFDEN
ncbi:MAG: UDP-N-acetylmuramoyl-tripeptide--D-alanyl-D-alanine ligase [Balneolaceae bacterium]